MKHHYTAVSTR